MAVTAAWGVTFVVVSLRRGIGTMLAAGNAAVAVGLAVGASVFLPEQSVGAAATWLFVTATHACAVASWVFSAQVFAAVVATVAGATAVGATVALGDLAPALVEAAERGVHLDVQVCGDLRHAPAEVRAELATHVAGALRTVPCEGAKLTLFCDAAGGSLFLTYPDDPLSGDSMIGNR